MLRITVLLVVLVGLFGFIANASGADFYWAGSVSNLWSTAGNWTDSGGVPKTILPSNSDAVYIGQPTDSNVLVNAGGNFKNLYFGTTDVNNVLSLTGGSLKGGTGASDTLYVGYSYRGTFNVSGGTVDTQMLVVGKNSMTPTSEGIMNVTGGTVKAKSMSYGGLQIGSSAGRGTMNVSGGTVTVINVPFVGYLHSSDPMRPTVGVLNISGGLFQCGGMMQMGCMGGEATINVIGGSLKALAPGGTMYLGYTDGSGTMNVSGTGNVEAVDFLIGTDVTGDFTGVVNGTLNMNGGTVTCSETLIIGRDQGRGHVQLNGGTLSAANLEMSSVSTGHTVPGTGTMDITGGTMVFAGDKRTVVNGYINNGCITAYGSTGNVRVSYVDGMTRVWAVLTNPGAANWPVPRDKTINVSKNVILSWSAGANALTHDVYLGTSSTAVSNATNASPEFKGNYGIMSYTPGTLPLGQIYYWRVDERNNDSSVSKGRTWTFTITYSISEAYAKQPVPSDYALKVSANPTLSWSAGAYALTHDVFFGTDVNAVSNATGSSPEFKGNYGEPNYTPGTLNAGQSYYWRVDERNNDSSVTKGATWMFTVNYTVAPDIASPLYVATDGNDNGNGSFSQPFRTIERARDAVRALVGNGLTGNVVVNIRGGTYYLADTLEFTTEDSGTDACSITYQAYQRERVIISGGKEITGWTSIGGGKYTVTLLDVSNGSRKFRHLWCDGERCQRSRWPNPGDFTSLIKITAVSADMKTLTMNQTLSGSNPYGNGTEYVMYNYFNSDRAMVSSINSSNVTTVTVAGPGGWCFEPAVGLLGYLENNPDYIDQTTEWSLNPYTGLLTYQAPSGVNPGNCTYVVPRLQRLVAITGTDSNSVKNIIFDGLSFQHAGWDLPAIGFGGVQAGYYAPSNIIPPAILMSYASNCQLQRCYVANIGCTGIGFGAKCSENVVNDCEIYDISGTGVHSGYQGNASGQTVGWEGTNRIPYHDVISNNYIHGIGVEWFDCVGVFDSFCNGTQTIHNTITNTSYSGISAGFSWDTETFYSQQNGVIQDNHIYDVMRILNDGGGIYLNGNQGYAQIIGNLIHNVHVGWRTAAGILALALYFDGGTYSHIADNIAYNIDGGTYMRLNPDEQTIMDHTTWGTNYWGVPYPQSIADNAGPILPTPVPIGWWKFDETSGATASDSSGFGYNGTINGAAHVVGKLANALSFDGTSNNVTVSSGVLAPLYKQVTISLWQYGDASQPLENVLLEADDAAGRVLQISIPWSDGTVYWDAGNDSLGNVDTISKAANAGDYKGKWNHWVFTKNTASGDQKIYLNGSLWHSGTGKMLAMDGITSSLSIGSGSGPSDYYKGTIDDVQIYDRELSAAQIRQIYVDGKREGTFDFNDLAEIAVHWLGSYSAVDIAPAPGGDGVVNFLDFAVMANHWLEGSSQ